LTYGIRRSATSRRTCRCVTPRRSATATMSNNAESSVTPPNSAHYGSNATRASSESHEPRRDLLTHVASRCMAPSANTPTRSRYRLAGSAKRNRLIARRSVSVAREAIAIRAGGHRARGVIRMAYERVSRRCTAGS
jgi:hypothetical protein